MAVIYHGATADVARASPAALARADVGEIVDSESDGRTGDQYDISPPATLGNPKRQYNPTENNYY